MLVLRKTAVVVALGLLGSLVLGASADAGTTKAHVAACKRSKTCKLKTYTNGTVDIWTGSGGQVWCPGEAQAKCIIIKPGGHPK